MTTTSHLRRASMACILTTALAACGSDDTAPYFVGADAGADTALGGDAGTDAATGGDAGTDTTTAWQCESAAATGNYVAGQIYVDGDQSERSLWDGGAFGGADTASAGVEVTLLGPEGAVAGGTCDDGTFLFDELPSDVYVTDVAWPDGTLCRTRNCIRRFPDAMAEGRVKIVTVGDSVPVVGDAPFFPSRLADILSPIATVENVNLAIAGTTSEDWVPGTDAFDNRLGPHIESADVFIVSIGGNDFLEYANGAFSDPGAAIEGFPDFVREVMDRVLWIKDEVKLRNPTADLVYLLYPDYAQSDTWADQFGFAITIFQDLVTDALEQLLDELGTDEDIIVVDFYGYFRETGLDLDDHLYDLLHFNDAGQEVYAERIFEALGGVRFGADPIGLSPRYALEP